MVVVAVAVAAVVAFVISGAWYAALGSRLAALHPAYAEDTAMSAGLVVTELARNVVLASVAALGLDRLGASDVGPALLTGVVAWIGFPAMILLGSVVHEKVPPQLAAIHAGDWFLKLVAVALVVALLG